MKASKDKVMPARLSDRLTRCPYTISQVITQADMEELGSFRYRVYVEQTNKNAAHVDHVRKCMIEPMDAISTNLIARNSGGAICGSLRITLASHGWQLPEACLPVPWHWVAPDNIAHVSRLMVERDRRGASVTTLLFNECFKWGLDHDVQFCTVFCSPKLRRLFEKYGNIQFCNVFIDKYAGEQVPMVFCLNNIPYLQSIRSPFSEIAGAIVETKLDPRCIELTDLLLEKFKAPEFGRAVSHFTNGFDGNPHDLARKPGNTTAGPLGDAGDW